MQKTSPLDAFIAQSGYSEETLAGVSVEELLTRPPKELVEHVACVVALMRYAQRYNLPLPPAMMTIFVKPPEAMLPLERRLFSEFMDMEAQHYAYIVAVQLLWRKSYRVAMGIAAPMEGGSDEEGDVAGGQPRI